MSIATLIQVAGNIKNIVAAPIIYNDEAIGGVMISTDNRYKNVTNELLDLINLFTQKISISLMIAKKFDEMKSIYLDINNLRKYKQKTSTRINSFIN